nr:MAG TPA: CCSMST1 family protein [Caudoviricetes sp.]
MTPQNINHLIDAIETTVVSLSMTGFFAYFLYKILKNVE